MTTTPTTSTSQSYVITSISGTTGSLHIHHNRDATARQIQAQAHVHTPTSSVLIPKTLTLYSLSKQSTTSIPHLSIHTLSANSQSSTTPRRSGTPEPLTTLAKSNSSNLLVAGSVTGQVHIWYISSGVLLKSVHLHSTHTSITALAFTDDDSCILSAATDCTFRLSCLSNLLNGTEHGKGQGGGYFIGHSLPVVCIQVGYGGCSGRVVSASADKSIRIWHISSMKCLHTFYIHSSFGIVRTMKMSKHTEQFIYVGTSSGNVLRLPIFSSSSVSITSIDKNSKYVLCKPPLSTVIGSDVEISSMELSPCEKEIIIGYSDGVIRIYGCDNGNLIHAYTKHGNDCIISYVNCISNDLFYKNDMNNNNNKKNYSSTVSKTLSRNSIESWVYQQNENNSNSSNNIFVPIDMSDCPSLHSIADKFVTQAVDIAFDVEVQGGDNDGEAIMKKRKGNDDDDNESMKTSKLIAEINFLRRRNQQLEKAGMRLTHMVERNLISK